MLKTIRIISASIIFTVLTIYFLDFTGTLRGIVPNFARIQFLPALLAGSFGILAGLIILTFLVGRIYCSAICPLGVFQDISSWISKRVNRKKRYAFSKERRILRYSVLGLIIVAYLFGIMFVVSLLDPYSAYGRMATHVFGPVYLGGNNLLAAIFNSFNNYAFYHMDIFLQSVFAFIIGLLTFIIITYLAWRYGRIWCNTMCPVGTVLGFLSRYSLLKIRMNKDACISCGLCERKCKASCIDSKNKTVDNSRCVDCYNCLSSCNKGAISYGFKKKEIVISPDTGADKSKRRFMAALGAMALIAPRKALAKGDAILATNKPYKKEHPISPPGAKGAEHLLSHCTACHLCVAQCPARILKPAFMEYGLGGMMQPRMDFEHGFCNYDCTICSEICPNGALEKLTKARKHTLQVGRVVFVLENCVVYTNETSCGACSEHCPTQAVSMVSYKDGLTIPKINPDICVGCGGCEYICPVRPFRAIYVEGNPVHQQAKPYKEEKKQEIEDIGFGF